MAAYTERFGYKNHSLKAPAVYKKTLTLNEIIFYPTHVIFAGNKNEVVSDKEHH